MIIELIRKSYDGNIEFQKPNESYDLSVPDVLKSVLAKSDGILETMLVPKTGKRITIGWIIYPYEMIQKETAFFKEEYGIDGIVFSDDGAGNPYYIHDDKIFQFNPIDNESELIAGSLEEFYKK